MVRRVRLISALAGATAVGLLSATSAGAATNLGETFDPPDICAPNTTYLVTGSPGNTYTAPSSGVISRWSFQAGSSVPDSVKLKIGRAPPGTNLSAPTTDLSVTGESASEVLVTNSLNSYSTRVPVQQGDFLGIYLGGLDYVPCGDQSSTGFVDHYNVSDVLAGTSATFTRKQRVRLRWPRFSSPTPTMTGLVTRPRTSARRTAAPKVRVRSHPPRGSARSTRRSTQPRLPRRRSARKRRSWRRSFRSSGSLIGVCEPQRRRSGRAACSTRTGIVEQATGP